MPFHGVEGFKELVFGVGKAEKTGRSKEYF
jgi:hypothetical protein